MCLHNCEYILNTSQTASPPSIIENAPRHPQDAPSFKLGGVAFGSAPTKKALLFSLWDGIFSNAMLALVETFSVAAAVYLKAPAIAIAMLGSLPLLLSSFGQILLPHIASPEKGRKYYVTKGTAFQSLFLVLLATSGWLPSPIRTWAYVILFALYGFSGNVISGLWIAWMGDLVPSKVRGRHFAWRNRIFSCTQLLCALIAGLIARRYTTENAPWLMFAAVFFSASLFRLMSTQMLSLQNEPKIIDASPEEIPIPEIRRNHPFLLYCLSAALMQGAVALAGPFFNVWYVQDLKFDYFSLSVATSATVLGTIVSLPLWGKLTDSFGNRKIILWTGFMISTVPLPYLLSSLSWHVWILNFYTGFCWSGYNLSNFNYLLLAAGKQHPERKISFAVAMVGLFVFCFSLLGGILATRLPVLFRWQLLSLFLLSSILRFSVFGILFFRYPKYERERSSALELFHQIPGYRAGLGLLRNSFRAFRIK